MNKNTTRRISYFVNYKFQTTLRAFFKHLSFLNVFQALPQIIIVSYSIYKPASSLYWQAIKKANSGNLEPSPMTSAAMMYDRRVILWTDTFRQNFRQLHSCGARGKVLTSQLNITLLRMHDSPVINHAGRLVSKIGVQCSADIFGR